MDFEKACDMVDWKFRQKVLERFNIGKYFTSCIKMMYNNLESCVMNIIHDSSFFKLSRGIPQGCPISAIMFILIIEILAQATRKNSDIRGIVIGGREFKISHNIDDTCLHISDQQSHKHIFSIFLLNHQN